MPLDELIKKVSKEELPKDKLYLLVCYTGLKTGTAMNVMKGHGYNVMGLIGGISTLRRIEEEEAK